MSFTHECVSPRGRNETAPDDSVDLRDYTFRAFAHLCDDAPLVLPLSEWDVKVLREDSLVSDRLGVQPHVDRIEDWSVYASVKSYLQQHPAGVFVKVADASPKDVIQGPLCTAEDLWATLATSKRVRTFLLFHRGRCDLVLRPWDARITRSNEFRVFVRDGHCVGISQQHLYEEVSIPDPNHVVSAITAWVATHPMPFASAVLDVFVDDRAHLIECNPFSRRSGSGLFRWDELATLKPVTLRTTCRSAEASVLPR